MSEKCWFFIIVGYLAGSIRFGYYLPKYFSHVDVTKVSQDGNPGAANAFQYGGILVGIAVLLGDMAKGFLPVRAALAAGIPMTIPLFTFVMAAPVLGHAYPFWHFMQGGKAIALSFGVLLGLFPMWTPLWTLISCYLMFSVFIVIQPHLHRTIITFVLSALLIIRKVTIRPVVWGCVLISGLVIWRHVVKYQGEKLEYRGIWRRKL